ncbi:MAG: phosphopantothenoylcysteine decarboxylase [Alphaproteobacteria bacterium]|nr:phosphopantothenoylcysteine decarboxylase [Alphaproteobacteria bacterium]
MRVLLGVSGGIAAYKAADLTSRLVKQGDEVRVVMTPSATRFVGPLTFEALSGHPVLVDALATGHGSDGASAIEHISWAKWAQVAVLAPMTANTLARLAVGLADDALSTVWMALPAGTPSILCPAMNTAMWEQPVVVRNLRWLEELGRHAIVAPTHKRLACGDVGIGGLAEVDTIVAAIDAHR